ncbi:aminopeptidase [bacterium]|nr:aminopeptidase [bacterium]
MPLAAQDEAAEKKSEQYEFTLLKEIPHTSMKDQGGTGTCWCFATVSFLEAEALRLGGGELDLSEMYIVHKTYPLKADNYVRLHGKANFSQGALSHDLMEQYSTCGIVPESVYSGLNLGKKSHDHSEMVAVMTAIVDAVAGSRRASPSIRWRESIDAVLDAYMGAVPETFEYEGKRYTPNEFAETVVKANPADYVELTSFTNYPFFEQVRLQVPDNWNYNDDFYNVPLDDLEAVSDYALENGYSIAWDGDVSERGFSASKDGYAIVPAEGAENDGEHPVAEMEITQENRQATFDDFSTTDDHLMHIVGISSDQDGAKYYYFKNSWGERGKYKGYFHMSKPYYRLKTVAIMVHKNAVPPALREKLGF